ncbi:MAG: FAD-dependent oxidoreductase [Erysipelotrichaceae bacterium]|nr:FAD-dependent oxidoreductase [Erysipelotrichaceae bacterium]
MTRDVSGLTKPLKLGKINVKNRIWNSPLWTRTATVNGEISDRTIAHYVARAKGGCGVITTEACAVDGNHHWITPQIAIWDDVFMPGHRRLVEAIHAYDTPIICQIHHSGMFGTNPVSPSGVPCADLGKVGEMIQSRVLTIEEIEEIRDKFIAAACRAQAIGYDGVEVHGATAYLLEQFFSPHNNHRDDKYGGTLEKRMELAIEIVAGIRQACGPDFIIGYCGADCDWVEGGIVREHTSALVKALESVGLTYFDLQTDGTYETFHRVECSAGYRRQPIGQFDKTAYYKSILNIPVTTRGAGEYDPAHWNEAFLNDQCDAIRLGKQSLADPDTAKKAINGDWEAIRTCIKCGNCINSGEVMPYELSCAINPGVGRYETQIHRADESKNVVVVGGGPAGIEAARVSALRGHKVTLLEKNSELGGNLYVASLPISKETFLGYIKWGNEQLKRLNVEVRLNCDATADMILDLKPDAVFVATGAIPAMPQISGIDLPTLIKAEDVLKGKSEIGNNVVIAGAGEVGIETADLIMTKYHPDSVTLIEMREDIGMDMNPMDKAMLLANDSIFPTHFRNGLKLMTSTRITSFQEDGVTVLPKNEAEKFIPADTIILAMGYTSQNSLAKELSGNVAELEVIGDACKVGKIVNAIYQANIKACDI